VIAPNTSVIPTKAGVQTRLKQRTHFRAPFCAPANFRHASAQLATKIPTTQNLDHEMPGADRLYRVLHARMDTNNRPAHVS